MKTAGRLQCPPQRSSGWLSEGPSTAAQRRRHAHAHTHTPHTHAPTDLLKHSHNENLETEFGNHGKGGSFSFGVSFLPLFHFPFFRCVLVIDGTVIFDPLLRRNPSRSFRPSQIDKSTPRGNHKCPRSHPVQTWATS